jgi:hypothetical protein
LQCLVEQTLAGRAGQVTEHGIGLDVFERPTSFDHFLKVEPALDPLRDDARYAELLKKTGLAD